MRHPATLAVHAVLAVLPVLAVLAFGVPSASADQMAVYGCHDPAGNPVGHDGWAESRTADLDMYLLDTCAADGGGAMVLELGANGAGYPNGARAEWTFLTPAWATIASYRLQVASSYTAGGGGGVGSGQAFIDASDESDPDYDYRALGDGALGPMTVSRVPPTPDRWVSFNASCDGQGGPCAAGPRIAAIDITQTTVVLNDTGAPTVTNIAGPLLGAGPLTGTAGVTFDAADSGPGVYSGQLTVDGQPQPAEVLDTNNGWCVNLGQTSDGTRAFAHPEPCPAATSGALALDTTRLADGTHTLQLTVDDAAGDSTTAWDGTITTRNAPTVTGTPQAVAAGLLQPGAVITGEPGVWGAPTGAGAVTVGYAWEDCDTAGGECRAIPGATQPVYTAGAGDVGHTLRLIVTASDSDGLTRAQSAPTPVVQPDALTVGQAGVANGTHAGGDAQLRLTGPPAVSTSFAGRAVTVRGVLQDGHGDPVAGATLDILQDDGTGATVVAHAVTGVDGSFTARVPAGPSRVITVAYRAYSGDTAYTAAAGLRETVAAGVRLHVGPRRTGPDGTITLAGSVAGPVPRHGVVVGLFVRYRGQWEPFRTPRTGPSGRFSVRYRFQGAVGVFPFRAVAFAGQAGYPYAAGASGTVTVRTG